MKLLIYEHVSAGGFDDKFISPSVLSEGFGMLRTSVADAKSAGHTVTTIVHERIAEFNPLPEADKTIPVHSLSDAENILHGVAENCDATYIIAPENERKLQRLVKGMEQNHVLPLNSTANAIEQASNKARLQQHANRRGLITPKTVTFNRRDNPEDVAEIISEKIGFPAVFKPIESAGCEATSVVNGEEEVAAAITKLSYRGNMPFMVQQLIHGTAVSVTLISNGSEAQPIALNEQDIILRGPEEESSYNGGITPLNHASKTVAFDAAKELVESIRGLHGYIGVDLVLTRDEPVVIEVNPRLTTSYVGIRKTLTLNLMQATIDSILNRKVVAKQKSLGYARFGKVKTRKPTNAALAQTFTMPEVVSPPFPIASKGATYAFLCAQGATLEQAKQNFSKAKKHLQNTLRNGGNHKR